MFAENSHPETDRRAHQRPRHFKDVQIVFNNGKCIYNAQLRNASAYGARLDSRLAEYLPRNFDLFFTADQIRVPAQVKWRNRETMGVEFFPKDTR